MMLRKWLIVALIVFILALPAARSEDTRAASVGQDTIFQVSTINALMLGVYDGEFSCGLLKRQGDLGIGTFNGLDGEMVLIDGRGYQVKASGEVLPVHDTMKSPFATVTLFDADETVLLRDVADYDSLKAQLDVMRGNPNLFYAFRIDGEFGYVKTRSVPKQSKPYPPLVEVTPQQPVFEFENVRGSLVGFWCPEFAKGLNVTGYHLHFISDDRRKGGHVLECRLTTGEARVDLSTDFYLMLPSDKAFGIADLGKDQREDIEKVEK